MHDVSVGGPRVFDLAPHGESISSLEGRNRRRMGTRCLGEEPMDEESDVRDNGVKYRKMLNILIVDDDFSIAMIFQCR